MLSARLRYRHSVRWESSVSAQAQGAAPAAKTSTLSIRRSSRMLPAILLILTALLFVAYALPSDYRNLAKLLQLKEANPTAKDILAHADKVFGSDDAAMRTQFWDSFGFHPLRFVGVVLFPLLKAYLEILGHDFVDIVQKVVGTVGIIAAYSLIPGLAGLIYRRQFTYWFLASFALLLAVNASGLFPKLSIGGEPMPSSGKVLFFLLAQVAVLLVAYRVRRHGQSLSWLPAKVHNWGLTALLVVAGYAIYALWDPIEAGPDPRVADAAKAGRADAGHRDCKAAMCPGLVEIVMASPAKTEPAKTDQAKTEQIKSDQDKTPPVEPTPAKAPEGRRIYMTMYEITHGEWAACSAAKACPANEAPAGPIDDRLPVEVSFADATQFAKWLSENNSAGAVYRLPSRAEWKFAARANAPAGSKWSFGNDRNALRRHGWWGESRLRHVGLLEPNAFKLYDMHGNLSEWVDPCRGNDGSAIPGCDAVADPTSVPECRTRDGAKHAGCTAQPPAFGGRFHEMPAELEVDATPLSGGYSGKAGIRLVREAADKAPSVAPAQPASSSGKEDPTREERSLSSILTSGFTGLLFKWELILLGLPLLYTLFRNAEAWTSPKPKNIAICLDGTSNNPDQIDQGFAATTNVYKLFCMLKADKRGAYEPGDVLDASLCKRYDDKQIGLYYAGVGNQYDSDPLLGLLGQATGLGAEEIVERAYLDLVRTYRPGDRVFIFGFSRGAAIARLLARAIDARGAPRTVWTIKLLGKHRTVWTSKTKRAVSIAVLGCWDTVGSFGVAKTIGGVNLQQLNLFRDLSVPESVYQAYHMVALDERRQEFEPTLMDPDPNRPERIIEVWFPGDHANIGGGWATDRLSDVTLDFLLQRISSGYASTREEAGKEAWGLHLLAWKADKLDHWKRPGNDPHIVDPDPLGQIQLSFSHLFNYRPRKVPPHAMIHDTVFDRMITSLPIYAPQSLFDLTDELDRRRGLIDAQVAKLTDMNKLTGRLLTPDELRKIDGYTTKLRLNRFEEYYADTLKPSFSSEYIPRERALALNPDGSLDATARAATTALAVAAPA